jgi:hypothetical protein
LFSDGLLSHNKLERWSMEKIRSCPWLAKQNFPKEFHPFALNLSRDWVSVNNTKALSTIQARSSFEYETYSKLEELGITPEVVQLTNKNSDDKFLSNRDNINGTYRIILHHLQKQSNSLERDDLHDKKGNENLSPARGRSMSVISANSGQKLKQHLNNSHQLEIHKAKTCIIL